MSSNRFKGLKATKKVKFIGLDLEIHKLSVNEVYKVQALIKAAQENPTEDSNMDVLVNVVKLGADELAGMDDNDIKDFSMDELSQLSNSILEYSGLTPKEKT